MTAAELIAKLQTVDPNASVLMVDSEWGTGANVDAYFHPAFTDYPMMHDQPAPAVILTQHAPGDDDWVEL